MKRNATIGSANPHAKVFVGERTTIGFNSIIMASKCISIGSDCMIAPNVYIVDSNHGTTSDQLFNTQNNKVESVKVGDNVWIGSGVIVLPGVTICDNVVVGAGSVVTRSLTEPGTYYGTPAKKDSTIDFICVARQTSKRFPNKIFAEIDGRPLISIIIEKLEIIQSGIIFAIPDNSENDELYNYLVGKSISVIRGSEDNVLERFCKASENSDADFVQRVNCDNLLFDTNYFVQMHDIVRKNSEFNLFTNTQCEIIPAKVLKL